jgi:signal transduction histidine kinase
MLVTLRLRLGIMNKRLSEDQAQLKQECQQSLRDINKIIGNVRRLSWDLHPFVLEHFGLTVALANLINDFVKDHNLTLTSEPIDVDPLFSQDAKLMIYRIFQETLNNIGKHAEARHVFIRMKEQGDTVTFALDDDGKGFDVNQAFARNALRKNLGLTSMAERVKMLGGSFDLKSQQGCGTQITFTVPVSRDVCNGELPYRNS